MNVVTIYRGTTPVVDVHPDTNSVQTKQVMGDNMVSLSFVLPQYTEIRFGDTATILGERYKVPPHQLPVVNKASGKGSDVQQWEYTVTMYGEYFDLNKIQFLFLGDDNTLRQTEFAFTGTLSKFLDLLLLNANRVSPTWAKGDVISTGTKTLTFSRENCLQVLQRLATEFDTEWAVEGKTIHLSRRRTVSNIRFRHGWNKGLYAISRQMLSDTRIVTRLYAEGSQKNLPPNYRNYKPRLKMRGGVDYLEENVITYDISEGAQVFDDIYPHRTGKVTAVGDIYTLYDSTLNFDLNQYGIPNVEPKIQFTSGQLKGYFFKVKAYNATTKEFKILKNAEEKTLDIPSDLLKPAVNDEYVLTDIIMPQPYIDDAERRLTVAAESLLAKLSRPQYAYAVDISPVYVKGRGYTITIGTQVNISDPELGLNERTTVVKFTRNIQDEYKYTVELSDKKQAGTIQQIQTSIANTDRTVQSVSQSLDNLPIQNNNVIGDLKVSDSIIFENLPLRDGDPSMYQQVFIHRFTGKLYKG